MSPATAQMHTIGDNRPPMITAGQLDRDFAHLLKAVEAFVARAVDDVPCVVEDDDDLAIATQFVKDIRGERKHIGETGDGEKRPYLEAHRTLHAFFVALQQKLTDLQEAVEGRANRYLEKKRQAEQRRRDEAERKARAEAEQARLAAFEAAAQVAAAKERAAAEKLYVHPAIEQQAQTAMTAAVEAEDKADEAAHAAAAKPVDMTRTRTTAGTASISTKIEFSFDREKVDLELLRPFLREDELRAAINALVIQNRAAIAAGTFKLAGVNFYAKARGNYR